MPSYLLRIEGVNLANFVYDTGDLSAIRGGSYLLLNAASILSKLVPFEKAEKVEAVTTGASAGVYSIESSRAPAEIRHLVASTLRAHSFFRHATFVVDIVPDTGAYITDEQRLIALNRRRQLRSPSFAVPARPRPIQLPSNRVVCSVDRRRPAVGRDRRSRSDERWVSRSVWVRRCVGLDLKAENYLSVIPPEEVTVLEGEDGSPAPPGGAELRKRRPCWDFETLTDRAGTGHLHGKMAVIYVDGNSFQKTIAGVLRKRVAAGLNAVREMTEIDQTLRKYRTDFLSTLLSEANASVDVWTYNSTKDREALSRLEILMWGGDEFALVVPAWQGWSTARAFFEAATKWNLSGQPLTCAMGLVFCSHKAPIARIKTVAEKLAREAKATSREKSLVAYEVFESFDYVVGELGRYRDKRCPQGVTGRDLIIGSEHLKSIDEALPKVRAKLGASALHRALTAIYANPSVFDERARDLLLDERGIKRTEFEALEKSLGKGPATFVHLADLWDYVAPDAAAEVA